MTNECGPSSRNRGRRSSLALVFAFALAATSFYASPASAQSAPLVTADGVAIRLDENAINGAALQAIQDELQPFVNDRIYEGAWENSVMDNPDWVEGSADLDLSFEFIDAGTPGYPEGGLKVRGDLNDIMMRFYRYGAWWQPECQFRVNPDDGWIEATAKIDTSNLPGNPITVNPVTAYWDNDPTVTREKGNVLCQIYLLDEWWNQLWGNTTDVAAQLEAEMNDVAQDLIDDMWTDYVTPVVDSLDGFGITWGQVRTDAHGLIVTADVDASNGIPIPGAPGGPYDVTDAEDSGATSDVNALLAQRSDGLTVSVHPNVVNQFLHALTTAVSGQFGEPTVPASIEDVLLDPSVHDDYDDDGWSVSLSVESGAPYAQPVGVDGAPMVRMDEITVIVRNSDFGAIPIAVFQGSAANIALETTVQPGDQSFGPTYDPADMTVVLDRVMGNPDVLAFDGDPADLLPYAKDGVVYFNEGILKPSVSLAPISIGDLIIDLCSTCGRFVDDERYTETFTIE